MKRLSKDERIGAVSLIIVSLLICGGSLLIRQRRQDTGGYGLNRELVRTIILARDSVPADSGAAGVKKRAEVKKKKDGKRGGKGRGEKTRNEKKRVAPKTPSRDHLSEPL